MSSKNARPSQGRFGIQSHKKPLLNIYTKQDKIMTQKYFEIHKFICLDKDVQFV
jgi:hypothetical protein